MFLRFFQLIVPALVAGLLSTSCGGGGSASPAPTGLTVVPGDTTATASWVMVEGVEYWLFVVPTATAPVPVSNLSNWIGLAGGSTFLKAGSPFTVTNLVNGTSYSFSVNGRSSGGPGGPGANSVTATPVAAIPAVAAP